MKKTKSNVKGWGKFFHPFVIVRIKEGRRLNVTDEEVAVKLEGHDHEIGSLKHRMGKQEEQNKTIQELALSVKELALNMQTMFEVQGSQEEKLEKLGSIPADRWNTINRTILTTVIQIISTGITTGLIVLLAQSLKVGG